MSRARALLATSLLCMLWWACSDGTGPTGRGTVGIAITPNFQVDPALFSADPVDRIRLTAYDATTEAVVGSSDQSVSATASQWALSIPIDLGEAESLTIVIEAELFSGAVVTWSGRLGPIRVPTEAPALAMDIHRGSLDNLDVLAVDIVEAVAVLVEGETGIAQASVTLQQGSTASPTIYWASSDESVATITAEGPTATITAVSAGTVDIFASSGLAYDQVRIEVIAPGTATKIWAGGVSNAWSVPDNWNPVGVPTSEDVVLVGLADPTPVLTSEAAVNSITVADQSYVDLGDMTLQVSQNVDAGVVGFDNGNVVVTGAGTVLEGAFWNLGVTVDRSLTGSTWVSGLLDATASLDLGGNTVYATDVQVSGVGGRLSMTDPSAFLVVAGSATFDGADHTGALTDGLIALSGNLVVTSGSPTGFAASGSHEVTFNGSTPQSITFTSPGNTRQRLANVAIANTSGVSFATDAYADGDALVTGRMEVPANSTVTIAGDLTLSSFSELDVNGVLEVLGTCTVQDGAIISGGGTQPCGAGTSVSRTWVGEFSTDWNLPDNWDPIGVPDSTDAVLIPGAVTPPVLTGDATIGSLTIAGANNLDLGGFTLSIAGDASVGFGGVQNGLVRLRGPGTTLGGSFDDLEVRADRSVSSDLLVNGNLTVENVLDTNAQQVYVYGNLDVSGSSAVLRMTSPESYVFVQGSATFNGGDHSSALTDGYMALAGNFLATEASPFSFVSSGAHTTSFEGTAPQTVVFEAPGANGQRLNDVFVYNATGLNFDTPLAYVSGELSLQGRLNVPAYATATIEGALALTAFGVLDVDGTVTAAGGCLDQGGIVLGSGSQPCGTPTPADFIWTGASSTSWAEPDNWEPIGVPGPSDAVVILNSGSLPVLGQNESVASITVPSNMAVNLNGFTLTVSGDVRADGQIFGGLTAVTGAGSVLQGYFDALLVTAPRTASSWLYTGSDLTVQHTLTLSGENTQVYGNLTVETDTGELILNQPNAYLAVYGTALFDGTDGEGDLTDGIIYLYGNLTVQDTNGSGRAFKPTGAEVWLVGSQNQTLSFSNPGGDVGQSFDDLVVYNQLGNITFQSDAVVNGGLFTFVPETLVGNGTHTLEVAGQVSLTGTTFDGLLLRMVGNVPASQHTLSGVTFTGMPDDVVQLYVQVPGEGPNAPLKLTAPVFQNAPLQGLYVWAVDPANTPGFELYVTLTTPTPSTASGGEEYVASGQAVITWGP